MMSMENKKMIKTIYLFGKRIDVEVDVDNGAAPAPAPSGQVAAAGPVLELPEGAQLLIKKKLEHSDVSPCQGRLLIPCCPKIYKFLTEQEMRVVLESKKKGFEVVVQDNDQRQFRLNLIYWASVKNFVLNKGWNEVVRENQLQKGDVIKLWCYRQAPENHLCFFVDSCDRRTLQLYI